MRKMSLFAGVIVVAAILSAPVGQVKAEYATDLEAFIQDVEKNYPFFKMKGIERDWARGKKRWAKQVRTVQEDVAFVQLLSEVIKCLRDGHAQFTEVRPKLPERPRPQYPGLHLMPARKGQVVVMSTTPNLRSTFPPGTVITRINNKPARRYIEARGQQAWREGGYFSSPQRATFFEYRLALRGERGTEHWIHYRDGRKEKRIKLTCNQVAKGWDHNYNLPESLQRGGKSVWFGRLEGDLGYIYLRRIDDSVEGGIRQAIEALSDAKGWIVDLRGNTGGGYESSLKQLIGELQKPVGCIIDAGCVSAGETFARDLWNICKARIYGAKTAGSSSSKTVFALPSGIASIRYSVRSRGGIGGKPIEFNGIEPHVSLEAIPEWVAEGKNCEIEMVRRELLKELGR